MKPPETGKSADNREHWWIEEQRELVQEALLEGEERLRTLLDDCMAAVYLKDLDGRYLVVNRLAKVMFRTTTEEVGGKTDHELWPQEVADALRANDLEVLEAEAPLRFEQRFVDEDGEHIHEITEFPLYDSAGVLYAVCGIVMGITECDRAEKNLRESEERFRGLVEQASDAFFLHDAEGRILDVNQQACESLGYKREQLLALSIEDVEKNIAPEALAKLWESFVPGEPVTADGVHQRKDGTSFPVEVRIGLFEAGGCWLVLALARDATERKEAEEALRRSEARFRSLIQNAPDVITVIDADGVVRYDSPAIKHVFGYDPEERIGDKGFDYVHPDDLERVTKAFEELVSKPGANLPLEYRGRQADGSWRHVETTRTNLLDDPDVGGIVINYRDITERKETEAKLREAEEKYRGIFENAVEGIYQTTADGGLISVNPAAACILGYASPEQAVEELTDVEQIYVDPARRGEFVDLMRKNDSVSEFASRIQRKDGSFAWISESARVVRDAEDTLLYYEGFVVDITERKETEEALKESEERFRSLVHNASDVITILDAEGTIHYESPSLERILGYQPEELVGEKAWDYVHPEDLDSIREPPHKA